MVLTIQPIWITEWACTNAIEEALSHRPNDVVSIRHFKTETAQKSRNMADGFSMPRRPRARTGSFDRFIPNRAAMDFEFAHFKLTHSSPLKREDSTDSGFSSPNTSPNEQDQGVTGDDVEGLSRDFEDNLKVSKRRLSFSTDVSERTGNSRILQFRPRTKSGDSYGATNAERYAVLSKLGRKSLQNEPTAPRREIESLERVIALVPHTPNFLHHNLTHSGDRVAFAFGPEVYLWNVTLPTSQACGFTGPGAEAISVSMNKLGDNIAIGRDSDEGNVEILDVESQRQRLKMTIENRVYDFAWTTNGIAFGKSEGTVAFYDLRKERAKESSLFKSDGDLPLSITFSSNQHNLVTGDAEGTVAFWDCRKPSEIVWKLLVHRGPVTRLAWCPWHANRFAAAGIEGDEAGRIRILDTLTGFRTQIKDIPAGVTGLGWYQKEQELVTSQMGLFKSVVFWDPSSMKRNHALPDNQQITDMIVMNDNRIVFTTAENEMKVWRLTSDNNPQRRRRANTGDDLRKSILRMNVIR